MDQFEKKAEPVARAPTTAPSMHRENQNPPKSDQHHHEGSNADGLATLKTVVASASARGWAHVPPPQRRMRDRNADSIARSQSTAPSTRHQPQAQSQSHQDKLQQRLQARRLQHTFNLDCTPPVQMWKAQVFIQSTIVAESGWFMDKDAAKEEAAELALEGLYADS